jgi:hypothetical protein
MLHVLPTLHQTILLKTAVYEISNGILIHSHKYGSVVCCVDAECNSLRITVQNASIHLQKSISLHKYATAGMTEVLLDYGYGLWIQNLPHLYWKLWT